MMSTTDCSKEEGMCSLVDAVGLWHEGQINLTHTKRRTITTKLSVDKCLLMNMSELNGLHMFCYQCAEL